MIDVKRFSRRAIFLLSCLCIEEKKVRQEFKLTYIEWLNTKLFQLCVNITDSVPVSSKIQHIGTEMRINHTDESAVVALGQVISN